MIIYKNISEDKKTFYYQNVSEFVLPVRIEVIESYTNTTIFVNELDLTPKVTYFTFAPQTWTNRIVKIYNRVTNELLAPFSIDGTLSLLSVDNLGHIKKLLELEKEPLAIAGIHDVLREHFIDRKYSKEFDIEPGDVVFDIGFNYGIFALGALNKGASIIYGFEPNRNVYNVIKEVYQGDSHFSIHNVAISNKTELVLFNAGHNTLGSSIAGNVDDYKETYYVSCVNLFNIIHYNDIKKIDLLKIDCEGSEYEIFDIIPDYIFSTIKKIHVEFHFNDGKKVLSLIDTLIRNNFHWEYEQGKDQYSDVGLIFAKNRNL
jgi:hypothetical protein